MADSKDRPHDPGTNPTPQPADPMLSVAAAAQRIGVHRVTLYRGLKDGSIKMEYVKVGRRLIRIKESAVRDYLQQNTVNR